MEIAIIAHDGKKAETIQFLMDALIFNLTAAILGVLMVIFTWPIFSELTGRSIAFNMIYDPQFWGYVSLLFIGGTVLSGFYPALVISALQSADVLKGEYKSSKKGIWLRNSLIIFQFFISITMISGMLMLSKQMNFMREKYPKKPIPIALTAHAFPQNKIEALAAGAAEFFTKPIMSEVLIASIEKQIESLKIK